MKTITTVLSAFFVLSTIASAATTETTRGYVRSRNGQIEYYGFGPQALSANNPFPNTRPSYFNVSAALKNRTLSSAQYSLMQQCTQNARTHAIQLTLVKTKSSQPSGYPTFGGGSCSPTDPWCGNVTDPGYPSYPSSGANGCMPSDPWCANLKITVKALTCVEAPGYLEKFKRLISSSGSGI